jgi:hypothetical protein
VKQKVALNDGKNPLRTQINGKFNYIRTAEGHEVA